MVPLSMDFFFFFFGAGSLNTVVSKWKTALMPGHCILM